jgi:hypothetical protein
MKKNTFALLVGAIAGVGGVIWFLRKTGRAFRIRDVDIVLQGQTAGPCGVRSLQPDTIELSKGHADIARWWVDNPEDGGCDEVTVRITGWKLDGQPVDAPVHGPLSRTVGPGERKTIPGIVRFTAANGDYKYSVETAPGYVAADPIVRIVD